MEWLGMEEVTYILTGMAWNGGNRFWRPEMKEVGFGLTGMAWNRGSRFWPE
jgi:hypothetical protein